MQPPDVPNLIVVVQHAPAERTVESLEPVREGEIGREHGEGICLEPRVSEHPHPFEAFQPETEEPQNEAVEAEETTTADTETAEVKAEAAEAEAAEVGAEKAEEPVAQEAAPAAEKEESAKTTTEPEKPLDKMTATELREVAREIPGVQGVHATKKQELLAVIKEARGIKDEEPVKKSTKKIDVKSLKEKIARLKVEKAAAQEANDRQKVDIIRRRINRLKKRTRKAA